jgi:spermidine synthase
MGQPVILPTPAEQAALSAPAADRKPQTPASQTRSLLLVSILGLFLELLLIRWIGTEIRIFAYLQNTVLVVCFLGLGMGCMASRKPVNLRRILLPLSVLSVLMAVPLTRHALGGISEMLSGFGGLTIWYQAVQQNAIRTLGYGVLGLSLTFLLMALIWDIFVPIGQLLGQLMDDHPKIIWAYSVNVAGSLLGIWLFVLLSVLYQPPVVWMAILVIMILFLASVRERIQAMHVGLAIVLIACAWFAGQEPGSLDVIWSPYQKLALRPVGVNVAGPHGGAGEAVGVFRIDVNNVGYQSMIDLRPENVADHPEEFDPKMRGLSQYDLPALLHPNPERMVFVGSGAGNDPSGGIRNGAKEVVAVEIDPAIIEMGRRVHPEKPYSNPVVQVVNDDARSYFATAPENRFDVIAFGLLDSHTTTAMTNARLDHYVYTVESLRRARALLRDGGIMVLSFEAQKPYIADRMAGVLREVWDGQEPLVIKIPLSAYGWGGVLFVAGDLEAVNKQIDGNQRLKTQVTEWRERNPITLAKAALLTTDDWPYIYLETPHIPLLYFFLAGLMAILFIRGLRRLEVEGLIQSWSVSNWHFFFLGAAFLLLEVQNISKASVVLGNTWSVNAVIISSVLILILFANLIVAYVPRLPLTPVYVLLCGSCLLFYFLDLSRFAFLPYPTKAVVVGALTSLPMLFSGIIFIRSFAAAPAKNIALGANLIGGLVGGLLQSVTFVVGIKALLLIVAALYIAAFLSRSRAKPEVAPFAPSAAMSV